MLRVAVAGGAGRMGQEVCRAVQGADDMVLAAVVDPAFALDGAGAARQGVSAGDDHVVVSGDVTALAGSAVDVVVDFTNAEAARRSLPWCAEHGIHAVVGTTGLGAEDVTMIERWFDGTSANAVVAPNFAIGAVLLMRLSEIAAPLMQGAEIIELHHDQKRDAPSGTAISTAARIAQARAAAGAAVLPPDATTDEVLAGARGGEGAGGVRVHSVRLPGLVAHQEVVFGALGQSLTLRHDSYDRRSFMPGVLMAVREVSRRRGVTLGLEALLGL